MKFTKIAEVALGAYLFLPGAEDFAAGGTTLLPSAALGLYLMADGLGWKL